MSGFEPVLLRFLELLLQRLEFGVVRFEMLFFLVKQLLILLKELNSRSKRLDLVVQVLTVLLVSLLCPLQLLRFLGSQELLIVEFLLNLGFLIPHFIRQSLQSCLLRVPLRPQLIVLLSQLDHRLLHLLQLLLAKRVVSSTHLILGLYVDLVLRVIEVNLFLSLHLLYFELMDLLL